MISENLQSRGHLLHYRVLAFIAGRRTLKNKVNYLSTRKLFVPKNVVTALSCLISTAQCDYLPNWTGNVWLVLSNFLGHTRSCGKK